MAKSGHCHKVQHQRLRFAREVQATELYISSLPVFNLVNNFDHQFPSRLATRKVLLCLLISFSCERILLVYIDLERAIRNQREHLFAVVQDFRGSVGIVAHTEGQVS